MEAFQQTSLDPYDRHKYRVYTNNDKFIEFEFYEDAKDYWFSNFYKLEYITVEDKKLKKKTSGFK